MSYGSHRLKDEKIRRRNRNFISIDAATQFSRKYVCHNFT
jgi:hypothetical protein